MMPTTRAMAKKLKQGPAPAPPHSAAERAVQPSAQLTFSSGTLSPDISMELPRQKKRPGRPRMKPAADNSKVKRIGKKTPFVPVVAPPTPVAGDKRKNSAADQMAGSKRVPKKRLSLYRKSIGKAIACALTSAGTAKNDANDNSIIYVETINAADSMATTILIPDDSKIKYDFTRDIEAFRLSIEGNAGSFISKVGDVRQEGLQDIEKTKIDMFRKISCLFNHNPTVSRASRKPTFVDFVNYKSPVRDPEAFGNIKRKTNPSRPKPTKSGHEIIHVESNGVVGKAAVAVAGSSARSTFVKQKQSLANENLNPSVRLIRLENVEKKKQTDVMNLNDRHSPKHLLHKDTVILANETIESQADTFDAENDEDLNLTVNLGRLSLRPESDAASVCSGRGSESDISTESKCGRKQGQQEKPNPGPESNVSDTTFKSAAIHDSSPSSDSDANSTIWYDCYSVLPEETVLDNRNHPLMEAIPEEEDEVEQEESVVILEQEQDVEYVHGVHTEAESDATSQYEITCYEDLLDEGMHDEQRKLKAIPEWVQDITYLKYQLFLHNPGLLALTGVSLGRNMASDFVFPKIRHTCMNVFDVRRFGE